MGKNKHLREKFVSSSGSISGVASVLGSWQMCHNVCLGIIVLLSVIGITIVGMPLLFLTKVALPLWVIALLMFCLTLWFYFKHHCISRTLILINAGLLIAGIPFAILQKYSIMLWVMGGILIAGGIVLYVKDKLSGGK